MPETSPAVIHDYVRLDEWNAEVPVTYVDGKVYYSLRILCDTLGCTPQAQLDRCREDDILSRFVALMPIKTRTGVRETWCIEKRGIGWWLATIQRRAVRAEIRASMIEFQERLVEEADRRFFSESERNPLAEIRAQLSTLEQQHAGHMRYSQMIEKRVERLEERN